MTEDKFIEMLGKAMDNGNAPCSLCPVWEYKVYTKDGIVADLCNQSCGKAIKKLWEIIHE